MVSEQAPEARPVPQQAPAKKENVFTRKLGPLPMWGWVAIAAVVILGYVIFFGKKSSASSASTTGDGTDTDTGAAQQPGVTRIITRVVRKGRPPRTHHHRRGDHDEDAEEDKEHAKHTDRHRVERSPGVGSHGAPPETDVPVGVDRRVKRGSAVPGFLVQFKTAEQGQTPSLQDVANKYDTDPEAIIQTAEGRGYPSSVAWKRYVSRHDWASPLPPATDFSIMAHPS